MSSIGRDTYDITYSKQSSSYVTHLSAMTVQHPIGRSLYLEKKASLGYDK